MFASPRAADGELLVPLDADALRMRLVATQSYAAGLAGWPAFEVTMAGLHGWELRRGTHPREAAAALAGLFE